MAKRRKPHPSLIIRDDLAEDVRLCEWPACTNTGEHKAPKSRNQLREYRWFCMEHVRLYNSRWNYFEGMSEDEVERSLRFDTVWNRPTWPIGDRDTPGGTRGPKPGSGPFGIDPEYFTDTFGVFEESEAGATNRTSEPSADASTRQALALFGLSLPINEDDLKRRYKELVKKHHPDANGGTKEAEERFKEIRVAYEALRQFLVI